MKKGNVFFAVGLLLIAAALLLTAYNLWDDRRAGETADKVLIQLLPLMEDDPVPPTGRTVKTSEEPKKPASPQPEETAPVQAPLVEGTVNQEIEYPDYVLDPNKEMPVLMLEGKAYVGVISIPAIDRELPVLNEWDYTNLRIAPCRYVGTAYKNDLVICAHNWNSQFGSLKNLSYGDEVTFTDTDGNVFTYRVMEIETLQPTAVEEMKTGDWDLTLFTCTVGGAARVTVRCERTEP